MDNAECIKSMSESTIANQCRLYDALKIVMPYVEDIQSNSGMIDNPDGGMMHADIEANGCISVLQSLRDAAADAIIG